MTIKEVHISQVKVGDTIIHEGREQTLTANFLKKGGFMGTTIFGDSYRMGSILVKVVDYSINKN